MIALGFGTDHALAIRTGPPTPVITMEPENQYQLAGGNVTFEARGVGLYGVTYQWQTNASELLERGNECGVGSDHIVQAAQAAITYRVVIIDNGAMGNVVSSNANLSLVTPPTITSESLPTNQSVFLGGNLTFSIGATGTGQFDGFPLSYQWQFNGANIGGATSTNYTLTATNSGTLSVVVSNPAGSTNVSWQVTVYFPGSLVAWGTNSHGQFNISSQVTNVLSLAAGKAHGIVALDNGGVTNWGSYWTGTNFVSISNAPALTNAIAVAAGSRHDVVLKADGSLIAFGLNDFGQTNVPAIATNVIAIAAGGNQSLALRQDGTVV